MKWANHFGFMWVNIAKKFNEETTAVTVWRWDARVKDKTRARNFLGNDEMTLYRPFRCIRSSLSLVFCLLLFSAAQTTWWKLSHHTGNGDNRLAHPPTSKCWIILPPVICSLPLPRNVLSANDNYSHLKLYLVASHRHDAIMSQNLKWTSFSALQSFHKYFCWCWSNALFSWWRILYVPSYGYYSSYENIQFYGIAIVAHIQTYAFIFKIDIYGRKMSLLLNYCLICGRLLCLSIHF